MSSRVPLYACLLGIVQSAQSAAAAAPEETPHLEFVQEYIRELAEQENLRADAEAELHTPNANPLTDGIHYSTSVRLALATDIRMMKGMHLSGTFQDLTGQLADFYQQKSDVHGEMIKDATTMMSGLVSRNPSVDYGSIAARMPQLRAELESIDQTLIKESTLVFATLLDMRPDSAGHVSHLVITRQQKAELLAQLKRSFGNELGAKNESAMVAAAGVVEDYLHKGFKGSDEPW
jgi:hypothetical protein